MKNAIPLLLMLTTIIGCSQPTRFAEEVEKNRHKYQATWTLRSMVKMIDSTFTDSTDINALIDFKKIDTTGNISSIDLQRALEIYQSNIDNKDTPSMYPIFEIKNSSNVILPVYGMGLWDRIWGHVLLDKTSMKVLKIEFKHKAETPGLGANITGSSFTNQFIGSKVYFNEDTYSLYQDDTLKIEGEHRIDGISGATITSKGVVNMLNERLVNYKEYLH